MAFPDGFLEEIRNRVPLSGVVGRSVRLIKRGREFTGLCPFHNEKSPSFTVNDEKGFFHCFGCGAHGDVIGFTMRNSGLAFPEAVEQLAQQAGLEVPRMRPQDRERAEQATTLAKAIEEAASWYQAQLKASGGAEARAYIEKRGLKQETVERFRLGYAPQSRTALKEAMLARGIPEPMLIEAGLLIKPEDGGTSYDRFRHRVMFPIGDRRGRIIAFGGRALDPDAPAKYLNSPETPLFHKGHNLYNHANAREAARESGTIVVVEGYMDVIALAEAGINHAVAPLGTALTEEQIAILWRITPEPILCFDGDSAGHRAALRAADRVLPFLEPGRSCRFAFLADGKDPDDFIRELGLRAFEEVLAKAKSLIDVIWDRALTTGPLDTPERRASVVKELKILTAQIKDEVVRRFYDNEFFIRTGKAFFSYQKKRQEERLTTKASTEDSFKFTDAYFAYKRKETINTLIANVSMGVLLNSPYINDELKEKALFLESDKEEINIFRDEVITASLDSNVDLRSESTISRYYDRNLEHFMNAYRRFGEFGVSGLIPSFAKPGGDPALAEDKIRIALALYRLTIELPNALEHAENALQNALKSETALHAYDKEMALLTILQLEKRALEKLVGSDDDTGLRALA